MGRGDQGCRCDSEPLTHRGAPGTFAAHLPAKVPDGGHTPSPGDQDGRNARSGRGQHASATRSQLPPKISTTSAAE